MDAELGMNRNTMNAKSAADESEVELLSWALLDGQITAEQKNRLEELLHSDPTARSQYIRCVQMHCDLGGYFKGEQDISSIFARAAQNEDGQPKLELPTIPVSPPETPADAR